jgi:peptidylprolyl isomerase
MIRTARHAPLLVLLACGGAPTPNVEIPSTPPPAPTAAAAPTSTAASSPTAPPPPNERVDPDGLRMTDTTVGTGQEAKAKDRVVVHYVGTLEDGTEFDSSKKHGRPFEVQIGVGRVIKGWDRGIVGMREGGHRKLVIPYQLAYGEDGRPPKIPPKATLIFEVDLLEVKPGP